VLIVEFERRAFTFGRAAVVGQLFVEPLVYVSFLAAGLQGWQQDINLAGHGSVSYLTFAFPGILAIIAIRGFARMIYRATIDRRWGLMALKTINGIQASAYVLGMVVVPVVIFAIQALVSMPVAAALGADVRPLEFMLTLALGAPVMIFWAASGLIITAGIKNYQQRDLIVALVLLPLMFSAPTFFPFSSAPIYLQAIGYINPLTYQVEALRAAFVGEWVSWSMLVTGALAVVAMVIARETIKRAPLLPTER
jgi:ABC-type multidrug transport system permease subunit